VYRRRQQIIAFMPSPFSLFLSITRKPEKRAIQTPTSSWGGTLTHVGSTYKMQSWTITHSWRYGRNDAIVLAGSLNWTLPPEQRTTLWPLLSLSIFLINSMYYFRVKKAELKRTRVKQSQHSELWWGKPAMYMSSTTDRHILQ
jgi:hypothetical protein